MNIPQTVTVSNKWQVVLPKEVRRQLNVQRGDTVTVQAVSEDEATITIIKDPIEYGAGYLKRNNPQGVTFQDLLNEKYEEIEREDRF